MQTEAEELHLPLSTSWHSTNTQTYLVVCEVGRQASTEYLVGTIRHYSGDYTGNVGASYRHQGDDQSNREKKRTNDQIN